MKLTLSILLIGGYLFAAGNHRLVFLNVKVTAYILTRSLREPGVPCTKSMEFSESSMERVKRTTSVRVRNLQQHHTPITTANLR